MALVESTTITIYPSYQAQVALLISKETGISTDYFDTFNDFSSDSAVKLLEYIRINDYYINLLYNKQLFYSLIYNLGLLELEILKIFIKTNLASGFNRLSKSPTDTLILFVSKTDGSLRLYIDY